MNNEQSAPAPAASAEAHDTNHNSGGDYPSNPLITAKQAVAELWKNGRSALAGFLAIQIVLLVLAGVLLVIAAIAFIVAFLAALYGVVGSSDVVSAFLTPELESALQNASALQGIGGIVALVCGTLAFLIGNFMNSLYFAYVGTAVVHGHVVKFGEVMRQGFKRSWALLGQSALVTLAVLAVFLIPALAVGPFIPAGNDPSLAAGLLGLFYLIVGIAFIVLAPRFSFASLALVSDNMGPIQSLKHSWAVSRGKIWELVGAASVGFIVLLIIGLLFSLVQEAAGTNTGVSLAIAFVELVVGAATSLAFIGIIAMRYKQAKGASKEHKAKYGLNIAVVVVALVVAVVAGVIENSINPPAQLDLNGTSIEESLDDSSLYNDEEFQKELNEWLEQSKQLQEQYESDVQNYDSGSYDYDSLFN